jgi:uncharacterized glyoxalase superfamily protein PhnB
MTPPPATTRSMLIPCMHYDNAPAAIDWLCRAFGFEKRMVVPGDDGLIVHAELSLGDGMIMMSSTGTGTAMDRLMTQPSATQGKETQCPYVIVPDADTVYLSAKAAGAEILIDIQDEDYGGRGFTCRDPEGHLWNFGSYNPWAIDERGS